MSKAGEWPWGWQMPCPWAAQNFANVPPLGLTRWANVLSSPGGEGGGWAQLELTDALVLNH